MKARLRRILFVVTVGALAITASAGKTTRDERTDGTVMSATPSSADTGQANDAVRSADGYGTQTINLATTNAGATHPRTHPLDTNRYRYRQRHANCDRQLDSCLKGDDLD